MSITLSKNVCYIVIVHYYNFSVLVVRKLTERTICKHLLEQ